MRITDAAQRLGASPRMLRYREVLGLLPPVREPASRRARPPSHAPGAERGDRAPLVHGGTRGRGHRRFSDSDLTAVALALRIEHRYDISPAALAFGVRVLAEPGVRAQVAELGRRIGRIPPPPARALEFEKERALRLLNLTRTAEPTAGSAGAGLTRPAGAGPPGSPGR